MKLAAVRIWVHDLPEAVSFYRDALGLSFDAAASSQWAAVFRTDGVDLVIEPAGEEPELVGRFTGLSFRVGDIAAHYQTLLARGVPFAAPPEHQFWGGITATFRDASGNELQLVEYPK